MNAALLLILAIATAYLLIRIIGLIDSLIEYWKAAADVATAARTRQPQRGKGSSR